MHNDRLGGSLRLSAKKKLTNSRSALRGERLHRKERIEASLRERGAARDERKKSFNTITNPIFARKERKKRFWGERKGATWFSGMRMV